MQRLTFLNSSRGFDIAVSVPLDSSSHLSNSHLSPTCSCDPMRITKKFTGNSRIGKKIFKSCDDAQDLNQRISSAETELEVLEARFRSRVNVDRKSRPKHASSKAVTGSSGKFNMEDDFELIVPHEHRREISTNLDDGHSLNEAIDVLISSSSWPGVPPGSGVSPHENAPGIKEVATMTTSSSFAGEFANPFRRPSISNPKKMQQPPHMGMTENGDSFSGPGFVSSSLQGPQPSPGARHQSDTERTSSGGGFGLIDRLPENPFWSGPLNETTLGSDSLGHDFESAWDTRHNAKESDDIIHSYTNYLVACSGHYPRTKSDLEETDVEEASKRASWT